MYQEKNIQIGQNHRRTGTAFETRGLDRREGRTRDAWEHYWLQGFSSVHTESKSVHIRTGSVPQFCAYHTVRSVHSIQSDLCKPNGHQFSNQMAIGYSFHLMHFLHSHQSLAAWFLDCLLKQTNTGNCSHTNKTKMIPSDKGDFLVFQSIPLIPRMCLCRGDDFPCLSLCRRFWRQSLGKRWRSSWSLDLKTKKEKLFDHLAFTSVFHSAVLLR